MTDDFAWNRALCVAGLILTNEERAAGWPAAFAPENLACLQYPWEGSSLEKKAATRNQRLLIDTMSKAIRNGALTVAERVRTEDITESRQVPDFFPPSRANSGGLGSSNWLNRDQPPPMRTVTRKVGERTVPFYVIERTVFRGWLAKQGLEPSEHVRAWLRPLGLAEEAHQICVEANKVKRKTKGDLVEDWIRECERRAKDIGELFDRAKMPGTKAEFLELLKALDREFENMNTVSSLETYLDGRYKWSGGRPKSAKPLYARLFPESRILNPGVVLPLQMKP